MVIIKNLRGLILSATLLVMLCGSCVSIVKPPPETEIPSTVGQKGFRGMEQREEIIAWLAEYAVHEQSYSQIPASITIAQAILETGWLKTDTTIRRRMIYDAKNLFGIKGRGSAGSVNMPTWEVENGKKVTINAKFRAYRSYAESFADHTKLLLKSHYYKNALPYRHDPRRYITEVARRYATDPHYAEKIWKIVVAYNLTRFDKTHASAVR